MLNLHIHKQILMVFAGYDKMLNKKKLTKIHWNSYAFCYLGLTNSFITTFDIDHLRGLDIFNILMMCLLYLLNLEIARNFQYLTDSLRFN